MAGVETLDFAKRELENRTVGRIAFIKLIDFFVPLDMSREKIDKAAKKHAVSSLLNESTLGKINPWNGDVVTKLVDYLAKEYPEELKSWIDGPKGIGLDPERVEQVEAEVSRKGELIHFGL